jgi:hypothetical protein
MRATDRKKCPNRGPLRLVRNTLNGATLVVIFHITTTRSNAMQTRPTCIIASGPFSRNSATRNLFLSATNVPLHFANGVCGGGA